MESHRFGPIYFDRFHTEELPVRLAQRERIFGGSDASLLRPIAFLLEEGRSYTFVPAREGDGGSLGDRPWPRRRSDRRRAQLRRLVLVCLGAADLLRALLRGSPPIPSRGFGMLARWEPTLRVAIDGQPIYDLVDPPPVVDSDGSPLDLTRRFTLDDPDSELADFLKRAGFLHLRGVVGSSELDALISEVSAGVEAARPDDKRSWWTTVDGREVCNRVNYLNERSELIAGLGSDGRFVRIRDLSGTELRDAHDRLDGNGVVIKVPGASTGLADLPWHRDCGMGGHPVKCPMLNVGIQLDSATAGSGQLQMIAGSHRGTSPLPGPHQTENLPVVSIETEPGDVTVHFGHTLHSAPPPADRSSAGRRALYLTFVPPLTFEMIGPGQGYNDVLFTRTSGRIKHVDELRGEFCAKLKRHASRDYSPARHGGGPGGQTSTC